MGTSERNEREAGALDNPDNRPELVVNTHHTTTEGSTC
jgi:hypothetical protein